MHKLTSVASGLAMATLLSAAPFAAYATNGYFLMGYGAKSRAMGGASVGYAQDSTTAATNPAGLADVGTRGDIDAMIFSVDRAAACCVAPNGVVSGATLFLIPTMGAAMKFNRDLSFGFAAVGAGANTRYNQNFFIDDPLQPGPQPDPNSTLGVSLMQLIMAPGGSYNINRNHSVGASLLIGVQTFRAYGLEVFKRFSKEPDYVTNNGNDWSYGAGARIGWRGKFMDDRVTLGATYASKVYMSKFDKYKGLFAGDGAFDIPENFAVGISVKPTDKLTIAFDVHRILYSDIPAVGNASTPISAAVDPNDPAKLGASTGPGFGWNDQTAYKLGIAYDLNPKWTVRVGYNYGKSPIPNGPELEFATLAPATVEKHIGLGATYNLSRNSEINLAFTHAFKNTQQAELSGTDLPFNTLTTVEMKHTAYEIGYAFKF